MASSQNDGFAFNWIIENMNCMALHSSLASPTFIANFLDKTKWRLECVLRFDEATNKMKKYILLKKLATEPYCMLLSYEISCLDVNNEKLETLRMFEFWFHRGNSVGESEFLNSNDTFSKIKTIQCRMGNIRIPFCNAEQGLCRTRIGIERSRFTWTIEKVKLLETSTDFLTIDSKKCPSKSINLIATSRICEKKLEVQIINNFECDRNCNYAHLDSCITYPYIYNCEISILDSEGNAMVFPDQEKRKLSKQVPLKTIPKGKSHDKYFFQLLLNSTSKEFKETCMKNGPVTFQCDCDVCFGVELNQLEDVDSAPKEYNDDNEKLQCSCKAEASSGILSTNFMQDMQQLLSKKQFCDVNLKSESETFPVHRAILSNRSPVFRALFSHDMKENANQSVNISDLNANTVRRMLLYIYSDKIDDLLWKDAFDLYIAGDKYEMLNLRERCSSILKSNLLPSNVCEILVLADERHDEVLKKAAQDYIVDQDVEILQLDAWKDIEKNNPNLGIGILRRIVIKRFDLNQY